ncbi:MAG: T9SS C-terminal target domain-containing protein [Ignavibacteriales bacterium]|nr:MAG: T9SS C-terminal target domain-containing protein [Ignavibacteriales bacterium]
MKTHLTLSRFTLLNVSKVFLIPLVMLISSINLFAIHDLEVTGNITELGSDYLIVQGNTIYVDGSTEFRGPSNSTVTFSYFQLNDLVEVQADNNGNGTFLASRVKSEDGLNNENEVELTGYVTEVGTVSFVVNGSTFYVDANTEYRGRNGNTFSFEQIAVGLLLEVKAELQTNGDLLATRVKTEDDHNQHNGELEITALIDNKTANSIVLGQYEFFVDAQTVILNHDRMPIYFSDLNIGDRVEVKAYKQLDNSYLAVRIKLEDMPENEIEFTAQIESILGSDVTINGITFVTDSNTVFLDDNRMPVTISSLVVGMWVEVKGFKKQDGSYYASRIQIEDFVRNEIELKGNITELTEVSLVVGGITFSVDSTTQVLDHLNNPISYSSLLLGQFVEVKGTKTGTSTAKALRIKIEGNEDIEIFGRVTAININSIELNGLVVFVNENTVYLNHANQTIGFSDLSVDQFVEVKMIRNVDSTLLALRIKIEDGMNFSKVSGFSGIVNGSAIQLPTGNYVINNQTIVIDNNYNVINASQLISGQQVIVWAAVDASSNKTALQIQSKLSSPTSIEESPVTVDMFVLEQNYPNPFNPSTTISFSIQTDQFVTLKVFNAIGEEMATLINKNLTGGTHNINFNADGLSSGFYIYRLESGNQVQVRKMMLLK